MHLYLKMYAITRYVIGRSSLSRKYLKVEKLTPNRRLNISETDCFFSAEICLKQCLLLFCQRSHWLAHPISEIKSMNLWV
jgi:hypothetical protein